MLRTGLLALDAVLLAACAYLFATGARTLLLPTPTQEATLPEAAPPPRPDPSFEGYRAVASRDLFRAGPPSAMVALPPEEERLEETTLRVRLIGTAAASDPRRSVAVIQEEGAQKSLLIRPDQELSQPGVRVVRVERKRVVVDNRGRLEEILFEEKGSSGASSSLRAARSNGRPVAAARTAPRAPVPRAPGGSPPQRARDLAQLVQELAPQPPTAARPESPERATSILTQARIVPRYAEGGRMSGLEVTSIRSGSVLEAAGFQEGDLVVAVNGVELSDAGEGLKALRNAGAGERFVVDVERAAGRVKLQYAPEGP